MDFSAALKQYQRAIERRLAVFIESKRAAYRAREVERWVHEVLADFVLRGGKRLRAIMAVTAYEGATGLFDDPRILEAACALEFLDAYFLVQDDVIDLSDLRRGGPSAHVMLAERAAGTHGVPEDEARAFGYNVAIGVGDIFNAWGLECLLRADFPPELRMMAVATYNAACEVICRGEIKDIYLSLREVTADVDAYTDMVLEKTGYYVTRAPALVGLNLAGASLELRDAMIAFTEPLGLAFQVRDDLLDLLSSEEELGKPIGTDVREGKDTLMVIHARQAATPAQWEVVAETLGNHDAPDSAILRVREALEAVGSFAYAEQRMEQHLGAAREALAALAGLGVQPRTVDFYEGLVDFIGRRRH
jgi:geranylgeranyl diphosphate synthase type I